MAAVENISQVEATIISASIGATVSFILWILKDVFYEPRKERRRKRRELVERKLSVIYSPLWVALGGEKGSITNILGNKDIRTQLGAYFHLLSPELQDIFGRLLLLGEFKNGAFVYTSTDGMLIAKAHDTVANTLKSDIEILQKEFNG